MVDTLASVLTLLACPACHGPLAVTGTPQAPTVTCTACRRCYSVLDGIPVLISERAVEALPSV